MGRPRTSASEIADSFVLSRETGPSKDMALHKGKQIYRSWQNWQAERVVLMTDEIEWRLFWRGTHVVQRLGDMTPAELREWLITEIDELFDN
jgi:hypothetical protein